MGNQTHIEDTNGAPAGSLAPFCVGLAAHSSPQASRMRTIAAALLLVAFATPASAQQTQPYALTAADAAAINARRPPDWSPSHVSAGNVFTIDARGLIHIPTTELVGNDTAFLEDLEPQATNQ